MEAVLTLQTLDSSSRVDGERVLRRTHKRISMKWVLSFLTHKVEQFYMLPANVLVSRSLIY